MNKNKGNVLAIGIMFFLFAMISFVTGLQNPMGQDEHICVRFRCDGLPHQ